jgi:hypothetical protein
MKFTQLHKKMAGKFPKNLISRQKIDASGYLRHRLPGRSQHPGDGCTENRRSSPGYDE